ncbi:hypothetical protein JCM16303_000543 [Sporobolomyces ruberrimus]
MSMRLTRALRPSSTLFSPPCGSNLSRAAALPAFHSSSSSTSPLSSTGRPCRRYSCSSKSSGGPRSNAGSSARVKAPSPSSSPTTSSSSSPPPSAVKYVQGAPRIAVTPSTYNLPHVSAELVKSDSLFALHRPLLELPIQIQNRRSVTSRTDASTLAVAEELGSRLEEARMDEGVAQQTATVVELSDELAEVVDLSEAGLPVGTPYLARLGPVEQLKSVEEELAAEAKEEEALAIHEEQLHDMEKDEAEPYDAWMIGQHAPLPHVVARYLALRPPHEAPSSPSNSPLTSAPATQTLSDLQFLSPFGKPLSPSAWTSPSLARNPSSALANAPYAAAFSKHFLRPLEPTDAAAVADQFLSHHQLVHTWAARNDFVNEAAESLRKAQQLYSDAPVASKSSPVVAQESSEKGTIRYWTEREGWATFDLRLGENSNGSPFLPAEMVDLEALSAEDLVVDMDSTKRKRKKKITKHKYKKRRKAQRALRQRLGK